MASMARSSQDGDKYLCLKRDDPIKFGEYLLSLNEAGNSQTEIAGKLGLNRQMVGRYQRMGRWPCHIKNSIKEKNISNTAMLNFAIKERSEEELEAALGLASKCQHSSSEISGASVSEFPNISGFHELLGKLSMIEGRLESLEAVATRRSQSQQNEHLSPVDCKSGLEWINLWKQVAAPGSIILLVCITLLTSYLILQGSVFFAINDSNRASAISSAVVSELVVVLAAACFAVSVGWWQKLFSGSLIILSIAGLGFFTYSSLSTRMAEESPDYIRLQGERNILVGVVSALEKNLALLPDNHIQKRMETANKIKKYGDDLAKINSGLGELGSAGRFSGMSLYYTVWVRVAAMIVNAVMVHIFLFGLVRRFKFEGYKTDIFHAQSIVDP